jgi:hypothetical protein
MGNQRKTRRHEEQCVGMANTTATYNGGLEGMEEGDERSIHRRVGYNTPVGRMV